ncbi:MAG: hypothetical protein ACRDYA_08225 [Egibacteraceae bacterium]
MTDDDLDLDPGADTETFRAFAEQQQQPTGRCLSMPFRILTLLVGLLAFALVAWLLLRA